MKKMVTLLIAGAAVVSASFAQTNTVSSANIVGYSRIDLPDAGQYVIGSCNFETGETNTLLSIFGTNQLSQSGALAGCDRVVLYDPTSQMYQAWAQYTDGVFYKANDNNEWNLGISGNPVIPTGSSFFIASGSYSNKIYVSGNVVLTETNNVSIVPGYQLLAYPFSSDVSLQGTGFFTSGASANGALAGCDKVIIFDTATQRYQTYAIYTDGIWYKANNNDEWNLGIPASNNIALSQGFFYEAKSALNWVETNNYSQLIK